MALSQEDLTKIESLFAPIVTKVGALDIKIEALDIKVGVLEIETRVLQGKFEDFEKQIFDRFDTIDQNFDALFKRDEARQEEYLIVSKQVSKLEKETSFLKSKSR